MEFCIPFTPPSSVFPNHQRRATHWGGRQRDAKRLRADAGWYLKSQAPDRGITEPITGPIILHIRVEWEKGRRMPDLSAIPLAVKAFEDALQDAGIIVNDSQVKELHVTQQRASERVPGVYLRLEEA